MTSKTNFTARRQPTVELVIRTDVDRSAEECSENEGMAEPPRKAEVPRAWEKDRIERIWELGSSASGPAGPVLPTTTDASNDRHHSLGRYDPVENAEPERRVLTRQQILPALTRTAEAKLKFLTRLRDPFAEPVSSGRGEHGNTHSTPSVEKHSRKAMCLWKNSSRSDAPRDRRRTAPSSRMGSIRRCSR
jgi:hypothetical protein